MPEASPTHNQLEYTVSEVAGEIKRNIEGAFGFVRVRGEISGWRGPHSSGHAYFRLKDERAVLEAVCWKGTLPRVGCKPEEGMEVVATGKITTYPGKSNYQIVIERMEPAGQGALMALLEKRKAMFIAEGLFAPERRKPLPFMPRVIGVVTSPTGAVIRDILHRIADRFPVHVIVWPVAVQGEGAAEQIAAAIRGFNALPIALSGGATATTPRSEGERSGGDWSTAPCSPPDPAKPDLIIIARGGGSIEDLWAFNEEITVRAAAESLLPIISAVGHETDTTLIDFVADRRAPTPTAAAEMAVPVRAEWMVAVEELGLRQFAGITRLLGQRRERAEAMARGLPHPKNLLEFANQRLDDWSERFADALPRLLQIKQHLFDILQVKPFLLANSVSQEGERLEAWQERLRAGHARLLDKQAQRLELAARMLESVSLQRVLERGFALVRDGKGAVLTKATQLAPGTPLELQFADGRIKAVSQD